MLQQQTVEKFVAALCAANRKLNTFPPHLAWYICNMGSTHLLPAIHAWQQQTNDAPVNMHCRNLNLCTLQYMPKNCDQRVQTVYTTISLCSPEPLPRSIYYRRLWSETWGCTRSIVTLLFSSILTLFSHCEIAATAAGDLRCLPKFNLLTSHPD